jgi:hypothetical protein
MALAQNSIPDLLKKIKVVETTLKKDCLFIYMRTQIYNEKEALST